MSDFDAVVHAIDLIAAMGIAHTIIETASNRVQVSMTGTDWSATCDNVDDAIMALAHEATRRYPERWERLGARIH